MSLSISQRALPADRLASISLLVFLTIGLGGLGCAPSHPNQPADASAPSASKEPTHDDAEAVKALSGLPGIKLQKKSEWINQVDFRGCEGPWDEYVSLLAKLPKLESVTVAGPQANDGVAEKLSQIASLRSIAFEKSSVTDVGVAALGKLSNLRSFKFSSSHVTGECMQSIGLLHNLVAFSLSECPVSDESFASLNGLKQLKEATVYKCPVSAGPLKTFSQCPNLVKLNLRASNLTSDDLIALIPAYRALQDLEISETSVDDSVLPAIAKLESLKALNVWRTKVSDEGISHLVSRGLTRLNLDDNPSISDGVIQHLTKMTSLEWLHLGKTKVTDEGLRQLATLTNLAELRINDTAVTSEAIDDLQAKLPRLKTIVR